MTRWIHLVAVLTMACSTLRADSILTREKVSVNGKIIKLADGEITLVAHYKTGDKTLTIKKADVEVIEFNSTTSNSGPPPNAIGLGSALKGSKPAASSPEPQDTIVLARGQQRRPCTLIGITEQLVQCEGGKAGEYPRNLVLRIVLGAQ